MSLTAGRREAALQCSCGRTWRVAVPRQHNHPGAAGAHQPPGDGGVAPAGAGQLLRRILFRHTATAHHHYITTTMLCARIQHIRSGRTIVDTQVKQLCLARTLATGEAECFGRQHSAAMLVLLTLKKTMSGPALAAVMMNSNSSLMTSRSASGPFSGALSAVSCAALQKKPQPSGHEPPRLMPPGTTRSNCTPTCQ